MRPAVDAPGLRSTHKSNATFCPALPWADNTAPMDVTRAQSVAPPAMRVVLCHLLGRWVCASPKRQACCTCWRG